MSAELLGGIRRRYRLWRLCRAQRRHARARRERIRLEELYGDVETIPPLAFLYEFVRLVYMQKVRWWFP